MVTILTESGGEIQSDVEPSAAALWLPVREAEAITSWAARAEGFCKGEVCVPVPAGREQEFVRGARVNVDALWRHLGHPMARSDRGDVWVLGRSAGERAAALRSLEAPDFVLPDIAGRMHSLSEHRGKKILLVTWASW